MSRDDRHDVATEQMLTSGMRIDATAGVAVQVLDGPDAGRRAELGLTTGRLLVGTSTACDLVLGDRMMSRRHAALELSGAALHVVDLGSTNGTFIDGIRVTDALAVPGNVLRVGATTLGVSGTEVAQTRLPPLSSFGRVVGASPPMRRLYAICERLAAADLPVLIEGEAGTGKELLAEVLHEKSSRSDGPFVVFDASLVAQGAIDAELFGAAATGGGGALASAAGGTLLVDDVSELPIAIQARLARTLASEPGGAHSTRVMATSRRNLDKEVEAGRFREDLFFRLAAGRIELPPLRARDEDVRLLATLFWKKQDVTARSMPPDLLRRYEGYSWPGNVRELESAVTRRLAIGDADDEEIGGATPDRAPENAFRWVLAHGMAFPAARALLLSEFERVFVEASLAKYGGNVSRAAAASGLARRYFQIMRARTRG